MQAEMYELGKQACAVVEGRGQPFIIHTHHEPLISLFKGSSSKPPPRIEKCIFQLQEYQFSVVYGPGSQNPADNLSKNARPANILEEADAKDVEEYVRFVVKQSQTLTISLEDIKVTTQADKYL
ncbi:hypothetical protein NDU88_002071 [Pleurodeles waltl]|uniref:Reverse transcriptase RNase H-like domain-containing protein n=1 Tax=Pleurodeles waltl TaxID=8319 RepID=A0AAV7SC62_PLEWA|nr:hypothetical protein NDU88_002071 [Pleurodeles waltl]